MLRFTILAGLLAACAPAADVPLAFDQADEVLSGSLTRNGATVAYEAWNSGPHESSLQLVVNGMTIDVDLDREARRMVQNGHHDALERDDTQVLLELRDAVGEAHPELMEQPHGELLLRHLDRIAEAPPGLVVGEHVTDMSSGRFERSATCGDDGLTCLAGTNGTATAHYDPSGGSCTTKSVTYGTNQSWCRGRCGAGCPGWWFSDDDYTQDCLDHDTCVDELNAGSFFWDSDCGDEFWDADDDYVKTFFDAC